MMGDVYTRLVRIISAAFLTIGSEVPLVERTTYLFLC